jgi:hypothetical protein
MQTAPLAFNRDEAGGAFRFDCAVQPLAFWLKTGKVGTPCP